MLCKLNWISTLFYSIHNDFFNCKKITMQIIILNVKPVGKGEGKRERGLQRKTNPGTHLLFR